MAHFAQIDENNVVVQVWVVDDADMTDEDGNEDEALGQAFCHANITHGVEPSHTFVQTSYNTIADEHTGDKTPFRRHFAGPGMVWRPDLDAFVHPQPDGNPSFVQDANGVWDAPIAKPDEDNLWRWNETAQAWEEYVIPDPTVLPSS